MILHPGPFRSSLLERNQNPDFLVRIFPVGYFSALLAASKGLVSDVLDRHKSKSRPFSFWPV